MNKTNLLIFLITVISLLSIFVLGNVGIGEWHSISNCSINSSYCQIMHICPNDLDFYCLNNYTEKSRYTVFYYCEYYNGTFNSSGDGYCDYYSENLTRVYPLDIHKYDKLGYDQLNESIKKDVRIIIETELWNQLPPTNYSYQNRNQNGEIYNINGLKEI